MDITLKTILDFVDTGALVSFVVLFATGKIVPEKIVDKLIQASEKITLKLANEIKTEVRTAVKDGVMDAYMEMNGGGKR